MAHARIEHALTQQHYALLVERYAAREHALIGQPAILRYLAALGLRRRNGQPLRWRIVNRWRTHHGCPIARGYRDRRAGSSPLSTNLALSAWVLSRFTTADLFMVHSTLEVDHRGTFPNTIADLDEGA